MSNRKTSSDSVQHITMPYATSVIDLVVDLAAQMTYTISVPAAGEGLDDERNAEGLESWLRAWLSMNGKKQGRNIVGEAAFLAAQRAQCIARTLYVDSSIKLPVESDADATIAGLPVVFQLRDPRYVYVSDGPLGPRCVVERWKRLAADVRALYPNALSNEVDDDEEGEWTEYWDDTYRAYFWDGEPIKQKGGTVVAHGYGCLPYSFGNARTTPTRDTAKRYRPILVAVADLAATIDTWYSIVATAGFAAVTNSWAVYSDQYSGENGKQIDLTPGAINYLGSADKLQALQRASMPPDFFQMGQLLFQMWQTETFPSAIYGQGSSAMAGYAISLLSQAGRRILIPIWRCIEDVLAGAMLNCVTICTNKVAPLVGDKIPLVITTQSTPTARRIKRKLRLDVTKFGDDLDLTVSLSDPMPSDTAGNVRLALESTQGGLLSVETALEKFKLSSEPATEMDRRAVEAIYKSLVPIEGLKLAQERGYAPRNVVIPPGFVAGPDGQLVPKAIMDSIKAQQQEAQAAQQPPSAPGGPPPQQGAPQQQLDPAMLAQLAQMQQGGAAPGMPQQGGMPPPPPGMPALPPELLAQLMQQIQAAMGPMARNTGEPTGQPDPLAMQALAGQPIEPLLSGLAGSGDVAQARYPQ